MKYPTIEHFQSGVSLPLSGLWSQDSIGIGEYPDLVTLAKWCSDVGMDLIQLLPLNDTGDQPSPYSALSAFALNPAYLRMPLIPGIEPYLPQLQEWKAQYETAEKIDYSATYNFKLKLLHQIYEENQTQWLADESLATWIDENAWVKTYAVYRILKEQNQLQNWTQWKEHQDPTPEFINQFWTDHLALGVFFAWIQYWCEQQLEDAAKDCSVLGVQIKGDIPILISEDSADVWGHRKLFDLNNRAGAPPDMFCTEGQNWRFPCYRWDVLKGEDYSWWKDRLQQASKFYHAFRIDHVLGFFRIWQVPEKHISGMLGRFVPSKAFTHQELKDQGFHEGQILHWTRPSWSLHELHQRHLDPLHEDHAPFFEALHNHHEYFRLRPFIGESEFQDLPDEVSQSLKALMYDRIFIQYEEEPNSYYPYWYWYQSPTFLSEDSSIQDQIRQLLGAKEHSQDVFWGENGHALLKMMREETDMLVCAEDLGVVPDCVAPTLANLNILSLKIERWARDYQQGHQPYIPVENYPRLSVCSPSCHDTSNLRLWWEEGDYDLAQYRQLLGWNETPQKLTTALAQAIVERNLSANSLICILPLQDWLSLDEVFWVPDPATERVNTPGTQNALNWNWKMALPLENLETHSDFSDKLASIIEKRKTRAL